MYGNKGVLKKQLWSQETGASDHRNGSAELWSARLVHGAGRHHLAVLGWVLRW